MNSWEDPNKEIRELLKDIFPLLHRVGVKYDLKDLQIKKYISYLDDFADIDRRDFLDPDTILFFELKGTFNGRKVDLDAKMYIRGKSKFEWGGHNVYYVKDTVKEDEGKGKKLKKDFKIAWEKYKDFIFDLIMIAIRTYLKRSI